MGKNIEETNGKYTNSLRRYLAEVFGKYIESSLDIDRKWKTIAWADVLNEFNNSCIYCQVKQGESLVLQKEHLKSITHGGLDIKANVLPACGTCNKQKGDKIEWKEFLISKELDEEKAKERIQHINNYRVYQCKWDEIQDHELFKNMDIYLELINDSLEESAFRWISATIHKERLLKYAYHVTTQEKWADAQKAGQFPADVTELKGSKIPCAYEDNIFLEGFNYASLLDINEDVPLVILSFELSNHDYESAYIRGDNDLFINIKGPIKIQDIQASNPRRITTINDQKALLADIKWSLSHDKIRLPGSYIS